MFNWPGVPSLRPSVHELADFAELVCWQQGGTSETALTQSLNRIEENDYSDGVPEEEKIPEEIEEAFREIERRVEACGDGYPFAVGDRGNTLNTNWGAGMDKYRIYKYLLLATRLNMSSNRVHANIDGTLVFEELAAEAGRVYLGSRAESLVFGTAAEATGFPGKVNDLCNKIREGDGYVSRIDDRSSEKDGKLDVVVWKHFADRLQGKLIAFGQCKTGTHYKDTLTQLQPDSFCRKWMRSPLSLPPMRMFFVAEALPRSSWYNAASDTGLLLDRCRIVDFSDEVSQQVLEKVTKWTAAAAKATQLPG